jgi:hypothetical protein
MAVKFKKGPKTPLHQKTWMGSPKRPKGSKKNTRKCLR